jgi:hypothetical protein
MRALRGERRVTPGPNPAARRRGSPLESGPSLLMRSAAWRLGVAGGLVGLLWLGVAWALN